MPPTRKPAANASPAPVVSTTSHSCAACSSVSPPVITTAPPAPRLSTSVSEAGSRPSSSSSSWLAKTTVGRSDSTLSRNRSAPYARIDVQVETSTDTTPPSPCTASAAAAIASSAGERISA